MLKILVYGVDLIPDDAIIDAEKAFSMSKLDGGEIDCKLIEKIEQGNYLSPTFFTDRFGAKISTLYMSTGCKAALAVYHRPDLVINCIEAGVNALSELIKYCTDGSILVANLPFAFDTWDVDDIDISYRGCRYTSFSRFADYMYGEWPDPPKVFEDDKGVEVCTG